MAGDKNWQQKVRQRKIQHREHMRSEDQGTGTGAQEAQEKQDDNKTDTRTRRDQPNKSEVTTQA